MAYFRIALPIRGGLRHTLENDADESVVTLGSDALKSALFSMHVLLHKTDMREDDAKHFFDQFRLSSAYPYHLNSHTQGRVYFYPKPALPFVAQSNERETMDQIESGDRKKLKKVIFVHEELFLKAISQGQLDIKVEQCFKEFVFPFSKDSVLNAKTDDFKLYESSIDTRLDFANRHSVDRAFDVDDEYHSPTPFNVHRVFFKEGCGLHFLIRCDQKFLEEQIKPTLRLLADSGIGADRSSGGGYFYYDEVIFEKLEHKFHLIFNRKSRALCLGNFIPSVEEQRAINWTSSSYQLGQVNGYSYSHNGPIPRNSIRYIAANAVLHTSSDAILDGVLHDLNFDINMPHPIYRDGRCLIAYIQ